MNLRLAKKAIEEEVIAQLNDIQRQIMNEEWVQHKGDKPARDAEFGGQDERSELPCAVVP